MLKKINEKVNFHNKTVNIFFFLLLLGYLLLGIFLFRDYGVSTDEPNERTSTLVNVKYILNTFGFDASDMQVPELHEYSEKYYGTFLQLPCTIFEVGEESLLRIYYGRHLYTFGICVLGYIAFFVLCYRLFHSKLLSLAGTAMIAFYPRFFAEQFYNIKDMVFVSVFMICMLVTVKLIESKFSWKWVILFALASAVATNVRIVGIIFVLLVIGYVILSGILEKLYHEDRCELISCPPLVKSIVLVVLYFLFFVLILPAAWENPIKGVAETFASFSDYNVWKGIIVFMGEVITDQNIPWYYIPVWLLVSVPVWYLLLFAMTAGICVYEGIKLLKKKENLFLYLITDQKYLLWTILLAVIPWLGMVIMHSTLYSGWRHCYFLLPPMVLIICYGISYMVKKRGKLCFAVGTIAILGMIGQFIWIGINHPYEMVYFNAVGKHFAAGFDRDYWHVATRDAFRYIAGIETEEQISIGTSGNIFYQYLLEDEERARIKQEEEPKYYIETYRGKVGNECSMDGYEEIYTISVDGFKISSVFKRLDEGQTG